jgi:hypothetical protein
MEDEDEGRKKLATFTTQELSKESKESFLCWLKQEHSNGRSNDEEQSSKWLNDEERSSKWLWLESKES